MYSGCIDDDSPLMEITVCGRFPAISTNDQPTGTLPTYFASRIFFFLLKMTIIFWDFKLGIWGMLYYFLFVSLLTHCIIEYFSWQFFIEICVLVLKLTQTWFLRENLDVLTSCSPSGKCAITLVLAQNSYLSVLYEYVVPVLSPVACQSMWFCITAIK